MKKASKIVVTFAFLISLTGIATAVDIPVSVTMPAIPGVNVPLIQEETTQEPANTNENKEINAAPIQTKESQVIPQRQQTLTLIQQDNQLTTLNEQPLITVRTLYER